MNPMSLNVSCEICFACKFQTTWDEINSALKVHGSKNMLGYQHISSNYKNDISSYSLNICLLCDQQLEIHKQFIGLNRDMKSL